VRKENGTTTTSTYAYDALGQLTSFLQSTGYGEQYTYDKTGNMTEKVLTGTDGIETALKMSYNKANQLTGMANGKDKIAYQYDKNGSMVEKALSSQSYGKLTDAYAYNALDQLTEYVGYDGYQQEFTYDANGMRLSKSEVGNGNRSTLEELLRGNIAGLPEIVEPTQGQINADEADMPTELEWATTEYLYDLTQEYYQVISETSTSKNGSTTTAYAYGFERIAAYTANSKTSYVYDGRGSVAQAVTAPIAGEAVSSALPDVSVQVQSFSYTVFGEQMGAVKASGFTYNAEAYDAATGMLNLRARQYEPALNRFSQKDIVRGQIFLPLSLNRYVYCVNNPFMFIDPSGRKSIISTAAFGGVIGAVSTVAKSVKKMLSSVKQSIKALTSAANMGYTASSNSSDENIRAAYNKATQNIKAREKAESRTLSESEKNKIFASACILRVDESFDRGRLFFDKHVDLWQHIVYQPNGKKEIYLVQGEQHHLAPETWTEFEWLSDQLVAYCENDLWGIADYECNVIMPAQWPQHLL
jgi:RHS repeat-associated protein